MIFGVGLGVGFVARGKTEPARTVPEATDEGIESTATDVGRQRRKERRDEAADISPSRSTQWDRTDEAARRHSETQAAATRLIDAVMTIERYKAHESRGLEGFGHEIEPYLHGMMTGLLMSNRDLVLEMREALAIRTCSKAPSDVELMVASGLTMAAPAELGSSKMFDCALRGRTKEDEPLWSMIDAWRVSGQPMPAAIAKIQENATDERTTRRLSNYEQTMKERSDEGQRVRDAEQKRPPSSEDENRVVRAQPRP